LPHNCDVAAGYLVNGRPAIVAFFYTRCTQSGQVPATFTRLARLQERMAEERIGGRLRVAAIN
jgi:cytochrome oxidase Cu insertion factor (SCO1/SenC/PrrC family)